MEKTRNNFSLTSSIALVLLTLLFSCKEKPNEYSELEYRGGKDIRITTFSHTDTLIIDAGPTSLEGQWLMDSGKLLFIDQHMVGVREYDMQGNFMTKYITRGQGPNEMLSPSIAATTDGNGNLIMIDGNWRIHTYNSRHELMNKPFQFLSDINLNKDNWVQLLHKPDPEVKYMYEFNSGVNRVKVADSIMIMPIITEHVTFNAYEMSSGNAKKYWRSTYTFISIDIKNMVTGNLFGAYPPIYRRHNIPVFSSYDFDTDTENRLMYVTFMADSLIFVRDLASGNLLYSFGCAANGISKSYPSTTTFDDYESEYRKYREQYGYYTKLVQINDYVFRGYKKERGTGYGLQIYHNAQLIGDIDTVEPLIIIGEYDGVFYGVLPVDIDNESFRILKFVL